MKTLSIGILVASVALAVLPAYSHSAAIAPAAANAAPAYYSPAAGDLRSAMRLLWEDHVTYTRSVVTSMLSGLPDVDVVTDRLLRNQADIGNAIKPFYGNAAGERLTALLKDHILIAAAVVGAARAGDKSALQSAQRRWNENATDLAAFLSSANPHWNKATLESMLQMHLDLLTRQVVARLNRDWKGDVQAYDQGVAHMMMFADVLTHGLVQQFPDKLGGAR